MRPTVDPRIIAAFIVAAIFVLLASYANAAAPLPSEACALEVTEAEKLTCLAGYIADSGDAVVNPGWLFIADAGPALAVVFTGWVGYRIGRAV